MYRGFEDRDRSVEINTIPQN